MSTIDTLITAEEFWLSPDEGRLTELVRGRIVTMNMPGFRHGEVCSNVVQIIGGHVKAKKLGRIVSNDAGVITERDPDTVRGADVAYFSYARLPREVKPDGYPTVVPEAVFEVRSPTDRWSEVLAKVGEYLQAGVTVVCVLDPQTETVHVYRPESSPQILIDNEPLSLPDVLGDFLVAISEFFQ